MRAASRIEPGVPLDIAAGKWLLNPGAVGAPVPSRLGWWDALDAQAAEGAFWLLLDLDARTATWHARRTTRPRFARGPARSGSTTPGFPVWSAASLNRLHETDLHLEPNEASDLCPVEVPEVLARRGWDRALLTVLDEAHAEDALALLGARGRRRLARAGRRARPPRVPTRARADAGRGSLRAARRPRLRARLAVRQEGRAAEAARSWIARVPRGESLGGGGRPAALQIARLRFGLHRAVNDALAALRDRADRRSARSPRELYIDATIARGVARSEALGGPHHGGRPPDQRRGRRVPRRRAAAARPALPGQRRRASTAGRARTTSRRCSPIPDACRAAGARLGAGERRQRATRRRASAALRHGGGRRLRRGRRRPRRRGQVGATVLADHPRGRPGRVAARPLRAPGRRAAAPSEPTASTTSARSSRSRASRSPTEGHAHYVIDEEGHVALRTLLLA